MKPLGLGIAVAAIVGFSAIFYASVQHDVAVKSNLDLAGRTDCPDHWHNGFDVYYQNAPGSSPVRVDWRAPRWPGTSLYYYEWLNNDRYRAPNMRLASHVHMSPSSSEAATTNQIHYEQAGDCVPMVDALHAIDADLSPGKLSLSGGLPHRTFTGSGNQTLHIWTEDLRGNWTERDYGYAASTQVKDGESFLVAFGSFTPAQVAQMQKDVAPALSHDYRLQVLNKNTSTSSGAKHGPSTAASSYP